MEKNKGTLITIIVLLIIFVPASIVGTINHFADSNKEHKFHFEGKLYFYDSDKLLGTYKCKNISCDYASYYIIDSEEEKKTTLINKQYAYIKDGNTIYLEDIINGWNIKEYQELKGYNEKIANNSYLTKSNDLWGLVSVEKSINTILENKYDVVKLKNDTSTVRLIDKIAAKDKNGWKIFNNKKEEIFTTTKEIVEFFDKYIITMNDILKYEIVDYKGKNLFSDLDISEYHIYNKYIVLYTNFEKYIYKIGQKKEDVNFELVNTYNYSVEIKYEENVLNVYDNNTLITSFK